MKKLVLLLLLSLVYKADVQAQAKEVYMFCYFKDNGQDGLHLAYSNDGMQWNALKGDSSFLTPMVSNDKLMRDPCIIRGADGLFHMVWTDSWTDKGIGYASSPDLLHWSAQQQLPVMAKESGARNCWAPEITYDASSKTYMIYWATTIDGRFPLVDSTAESKYNHRIYYITTKDFKSYSPTRLLFDPGFNSIDVMIKDIEFCKEHYQAGYSFIHLNVSNPTYAKTQSTQLQPWPVADESRELVTALSVWTHLNETDAVFYFKEISRVLKNDGKAIITFFLLNDEYEESLKRRSNALGRFHSTNQKEWIFDVPAYNSKNWYTTIHAKNPEDVIGVTSQGIEQLLTAAGLKMIRYYPGNWKEIPGVFFQDVLIIGK
jgi:SAM-dependent methyltransferase